MNEIKRKYIIYDFSTSQVEYMLSVLNEKGSEGYKIINTHYSKSQYTESVRYISELEY